MDELKALLTSAAIAGLTIIGLVGQYYRDEATTDEKILEAIKAGASPKEAMCAFKYYDLYDLYCYTSTNTGDK